MSDPIIHSDRLDLHPIPAALYEASLRGDEAAAAQALGCTVPGEWYDYRNLMSMRLSQLRADPSLAPWLLRAVVQRSECTIVGRIGFHTSPRPGCLGDIAPGAVEFGYAIFPPWRRHGYAREACIALMRWAETEHQVHRFILSISPSNVASLGLAHQLGFVRIGEHMDDEDGIEDIYLKDRGTLDDEPPGIYSLNSAFP